MRYFLILLFSLLVACGSKAPSIKPFKVEIQQGNIVTSKMLLQLRPGMTKSQVRFIMGTPLIVDSFHTNRWDYFYQLRQSGKVVEQRRVILDFEKDLLARVRGDVVPAGTPGADSGEVTLSKPETAAKQAEDEGVLDKLKFWKEDKPATAKPEPEKVPDAKPASKKSLLERLKFWKKEEKVPETANVEAKPAEASAVENPALPTEVATETAAESQEAPSVLAVPIPIGPSADVPAIELPKVETPVAEPAPLEIPKPEPVAVESVPTAPTPEPVEPPKEALIAVPEKIEPAQVPTEPPLVNTNQDEKLIFRMDRTLDTKALEQELAPNVTSPATDKTTQEKKKGEEKPLPAEAEPGYFERMLEKIGF
ncbi:MAG: outer membrane protein assembly factor BamE domain-containing protein [Methylophilaceae bacterium]